MEWNNGVSEGLKAEEILKERQRHQEALLKVLPIGIFQIGLNGDCNFCNEKICEILGLSPEEIYGVRWIQAIHPEDREEVLSEWNRCKNNCQDFKMKYRFTRPDGKAVWALVQAVPYEGLGGEIWYVGSLSDLTDYVSAKMAPRESKVKFKSYKFNELKQTQSVVTLETSLGKKDSSEIAVELKAAAVSNNCYLAFVRDVTQRKLVGKQLKRSIEQYQLIFNNSPLGIFHFDEKGAITACNERFMDILGSSEDRLIGFNMLTELKDEAMKAAVCTALTGQTGHYKGLYQSVTSGKVVPLEAVFRGIISGEGKLRGAVGMIEDVTNKWRAEEELYRSELYNDLIINGVSEGLSLYEVTEDLNFRFVKVNRNLLHTFNLQEDQLLGRLIQEVIKAEIAKQWIENNRLVAQTGKPARFTEENEYGCFETNLIPILDARGRCTHLICSTLNVTEKRKMQEYHMQMEKLQSIGLLAGGIAHDFNNILTVIAGNISLSRFKLKKMAHAEADYVASLLNEAEKASLEARHLTQQLLTFAKGGEPVTKAISIDGLIQETANFVLRGSSAKANFIISDELWPVEVDSGLISQVLQNLIINANQAMPDGGQITIVANNEVVRGNAQLPLKEGQYVKISITDQGVGIPQKHLENIFDPYFTTKQAGNGLGLTIVHSIVTKHKGYISVESRQGKGTTFYIYLPASSLEKGEELGQERGRLMGSGRILLMDDDMGLRKIVGDMLTHIGYEAAFARDGLEALQIYKAASAAGQPFNAVIMDLTIPGGVGGREAIGKLLELDPEAKAIVASGYSNDPVMARHEEYGFKAVVKKPFSIEEIGRALKEILS